MRHSSSSSIREKSMRHHETCIISLMFVFYLRYYKAHIQARADYVCYIIATKLIFYMSKASSHVCKDLYTRKYYQPVELLLAGSTRPLLLRAASWCCQDAAWHTVMDFPQPWPTRSLLLKEHENHQYCLVFRSDLPCGPKTYALVCLKYLGWSTATSNQARSVNVGKATIMPKCWISRLGRAANRT